MLIQGQDILREPFLMSKCRTQGNISRPVQEKGSEKAVGTLAVVEIRESSLSSPQNFFPKRTERQKRRGGRP